MANPIIVLVTRGMYETVLITQVFLYEKDMYADKGCEDWKAEEFCKETTDLNASFWTKAEIVKEGELVWTRLGT